MLDVCSWTEIDRKLYFKAYSSVGGTYCYDIDNDKLSLISEELQKEKWSPNAYFRVAALENKIIFSPYFRDNDFFIYDISKDEKTYLKKEKKDTYRSCIIYKRKAYAIGKKICEIVEIDMDNNQIRYPFETINDDIRINSYSNVYLCENCIYANVNKKDSLLRINLDSYDYKIIEMPKFNAEYGTIVRCNGFFYLTGNVNWILKWDGDSSFEKIMLADNIRENESIGWKQLFSDIIVIGDKLYMAPLYYRAVISYDCVSNKVEVVCSIENDLITWGFTTYDNYLCFSLVYPNGTMKKFVRINIFDNEELDNDIFDLDKFEDLNLCRYGIEYSKHALDRFIDMVIDDD